ncbi:hypothetical protein GOEFS_055_00130 [Gordonia effusa NBRC 100432]|uniref:Thioesterase domain-containing protein n=1 Tax=Gordonia effusa NBRC 100432 TaxID=1077974 RepID=H0R099_9ACTN|nr:hypothetical protein GOEFS_055_00130 [Gordonia effusa NBRC 100432]
MRIGYLGVSSAFVVPEDSEVLTRHPKARRAGELIDLHHTMCHGCGDDAIEGLRIKVYAAEGFTVRAKMDVQRRMEGGPGTIHGGVLSAAFDEVMGHLPLLIGPGAVTAHLEIDFSAPIPLGSTLYFEGRILAKQRRKIYTEVVAHLQDPAVNTEPPVVATGRALFIQVNGAAHYGKYVANSQVAEHYSKITPTGDGQ